jgi:ABC-type Fe3+-siderophore transport system permease subunit
LGVAGFVYQTVFRNSLASPDIIGVSSVPVPVLPQVFCFSPEPLP